MASRHHDVRRAAGMNFARTIVAAIVASIVANLALLTTAHAQDHPNRPITLVVPYPAGGGNDVIARIVADRLGAQLGQRIVVENKGGAGGTIATRQVARSEPDGTTLLIATSSLAINPSLYPNVGYEPRKDFSPIGLIATSSNVVLVNNAMPVRSIAELIAFAKRQPAKLDFASTGAGSSVHLAAELFAAMADVRLNAVPYKGSGPALSDVVGGHVPLMFSPTAGAIGLVRDNKVRALAVTAARRSQLFPELPTVAEAGLPGYEAVLHYGIVAPAGVPRPIVERLNAALRMALADPDMQRRLLSDGAEPLPSSPEEYAADIAAEERKWSEIVRKA